MTNTIPNVPRELLADLLGDDHDKRIMAERHLLAMLANAPSPAGVDGLEVVAWVTTGFSGKSRTRRAFTVNADDAARQHTNWTPHYRQVNTDQLCRLSDAKAIIDGLRGEVAGLRKRAKTAERESGSALRTYKGLEKVARVVSDNSDQVCGELNVLRQQFDQHAKRIGELEGLLREVRLPDDIGRMDIWTRIDAALSAGKEG